MEKLQDAELCAKEGKCHNAITGCNLNVCVDTGRDVAEEPWDSNSPISRLYSKRSCYIESGQVIDETGNYFDSECNAEWDPTTLTNGDKCNDEALNQGRVYSMLNWGIVTSGGLDWIAIRDWHAEDQTTTRIYGNGAYFVPCTPFILDSGDFIVGVKTWRKPENNWLQGLEFYTRNSNTYSCIIASTTGAKIETYNYNYGPYNFAYLTGWTACTGAVIDDISFQFTISTLTEEEDRGPIGSRIAIADGSDPCCNERIARYFI